MFTAFLLGSLIWILALGGKAFLLLLAQQPLIGPVAAWYMGLVGELGSGVSSNLVYGAMCVQLLVLSLAPVLYGPALLQKVFAWVGSRYAGAAGAANKR